MFVKFCNQSYLLFPYRFLYTHKTERFSHLSPYCCFIIISLLFSLILFHNSSTASRKSKQIQQFNVCGKLLFFSTVYQHNALEFLYFQCFQPVENLCITFEFFRFKRIFSLLLLFFTDDQDYYAHPHLFSKENNQNSNTRVFEPFHKYLFHMKHFLTVFCFDIAGYMIKAEPFPVRLSVYKLFHVKHYNAKSGSLRIKVSSDGSGFSSSSTAVPLLFET